ncbi:site-specific DNA-methyltransferase (adenine-specific) TthHB8I, partial [Hydrogenivirga sp. 128-5-R1-1]
MVKNTNVETHVVRVNNKIKHIKKIWGIFFTPEWIVDFMTNLIDENKLNLSDLKILEPACGICQFLHGIRKNKKHIFIHASKRIGVEINKEIIDYVEQNNSNNDIQIILHDYLLWETDSRFDVIIGNPPYGIPSLSEHYSIKVDSETKRIY